MGVEMDVDLSNTFSVDLSPNTVLPPLKKSSITQKTGKSKHYDDDMLILEDDFTEISLVRYSSDSCRSNLTAIGEEDRVEFKRGSVYQSSRTMNKIKERRNENERKKIEISSGSDDSMYFEIDNFLSGWNEERIQKRDQLAMESSSENGDKFVPSDTDNSSKSRFSPIRKLFDPFMKSKSMRSSSSVRTSDLRRNMTYRKALLHEFDKAAKISEFDKHCSIVSSSPVHLHGMLKLENSHGLPYYELSLNSPEDIFVAKSWKSPENDFNGFYTFHSVNQRKKSNSSGWRMKVSSYLTSDFKNGVFINSIVTEFVLYDTVRGRNSVSTRDSGCSQHIRPKIQQIHAFDSADQDLNFEIAAIVMENPVEKSDEMSGGERVKAVISSGSHGLATAESEGPSPLLDRWRLGGGCDCGGWDMACPLTILSNPEIHYSKDSPLMENQMPFKLFTQGAKDNTPALIVTMAEEGQYNVDFHAKLSTLQAFSICVALLHDTETRK